MWVVRSVTVNILFTLVVRADLVPNLFDRAFRAAPLLRSRLENTTLGKPSHAAFPHTSFRTMQSLSLPLSNRYIHKSCPKRYQARVSRGFAMAVSNDAYYVTSPIYYVNGEPHLGHAYTSVACDVMARFARKCGKETLFLTGTDEHGQKVQQSAEKLGTTPLQFADDMSGRFRSLVSTLGCSHDDFIRTTEERHKQGVRKLWSRLEEKGYIYKGAYEGWYSIRDEAFYKETELVEGKAPTGADVEWVTEESYFFKLSAFTEPLLEHFKNNQGFVGPEERRNEVLAFIGQEGGLTDLCISRTTFSWGVPVPGDEKHVVYVWLDALTNYITALGYPEESTNMGKFWPADVHVVGKDILRFHAVFWPAFLMAADLPLPKRIYAHGWWTKDGEKMSKSVGNVLDPFDLVDEYGVDFLRYYLVSGVPFGNDGDFSQESFTRRINSNLANEIGNLVSRCVAMIVKNCDKTIPEPESGLLPEDLELLQAAEDALVECKHYMEKQQLHLMVESIINVARMTNKYFAVQAPWVLKDNENYPRMRTVLYTAAEAIRRIAVMLEPVMPTSCGRILDQLGASDELRSFASVTDSLRLAPGTAVLKPKAVFPRIEVDAATTATTTAVPKASVVIPDLPSGDLAEQIDAVGTEIRTLKGKLKLEGLSGNKINKHPEVEALVKRLKDLKAAR